MIVVVSLARCQGLLLRFICLFGIEKLLGTGGKYMTTTVGSIVHPWYKGVHEWRVRATVELERPIGYMDPVQGIVHYSPKIMKLEGESGNKVLWFNYWMSTNKTNGKMRYGGGPPMLEEGVFLELMKDGIQKGLFSKSFLKKLDSEIQSCLK
jgi:hypothetical protein